MPPAGFEPTIPSTSGRRLQALDRLAVFSRLFRNDEDYGKYNRLMNVEKKVLRKINIPFVWDVTQFRPINTDVSKDHGPFIFRISQFMIRRSKTSA
jgi:hypothetical protein